MGDTSIQWTDKTWNPVRGCSRVSQGCVHCYAERQAARFSKPAIGVLGERGLIPSEQPAAYPAGPFNGFVHIVNGHPVWTGKVELVERHLSDPMHWKKPARVFVNSMSDLFHEALSDEAIDRVFAVMAMCPQHTFQVLTKRPKRMLEWATRTNGNHCIEAIDIGRGTVRSGSWIDPIEDVWMGVSVEDQKTADERIPLLLQTPAAVRFVSYEPALGPVNFRDYLGPDKVAWVIVGGES